MKLNRTWAMVVAIVMALTLSLSGTLAYLSDTDQDVNVMTLGNVQIEQLEYQRAEGVGHTATAEEGDLVPFVQGQPLYPAVPKAGATNPYTAEPTDLFSWGPYVTAEGAGNGLWNDSKIANVVDKFVFVKNTGKSDAYYRTLIAFECPEGMAYGQGSDKEFMMNVNGNALFDWANHGYITVNDVRYLLMSATYTAVLTPGEISRPSLLQVLMTEHCTNEHMELLGDSYEILVVSQAVQAAGFDSAATALNQAFGPISDKSHPWMDGQSGDQKPDGAVNNVTTQAEFEAALAAANDGDTIILAAGNYHATSAAQGKTLTIIGADGAVIEVIPGGQSEANGQLDYSFDGSNITFSNVTIKTNSQLYAGYARLSAVYNNCTIQNTYNLGVGTSEFNNCVFNITNEYLRVGGASEATFNGCTFNTDGRAILVFQDGTNVDQTVTVKDCTFNATAAANTWNGIHVAAVSIDGTNGSYVVNLEGNNAVDSDFNGLWQIKTGNANVTVNE